MYVNLSQVLGTATTSFCLLPLLLLLLLFSTGAFRIRADHCTCTVHAANYAGNHECMKSWEVGRYKRLCYPRVLILDGIACMRTHEGKYVISEEKNPICNFY